MSVYVDDMEAPYGRMKMCHMIADTHAELVAMVDSIGVQRKWIQDAGQDHEHFDISLAKRDLAVRAGALKVTMRELVEKLNEREDDLSAYFGATCTGVSAVWCPVHGNCSCPDRESHMDDPDCPLHSPDSTHAEGSR